MLTVQVQRLLSCNGSLVFASPSFFSKSIYLCATGVRFHSSGSPFFFFYLCAFRCRDISKTMRVHTGSADRFSSFVNIFPTSSTHSGRPLDFLPPLPSRTSTRNEHPHRVGIGDCQYDRHHCDGGCLSVVTFFFSHPSYIYFSRCTGPIDDHDKTDPH
jgi:hypothetical protein